MVSIPNRKSHPVTWNWAHSAQTSAYIWGKLDPGSLKGLQIQPVFWVCNKPSETGEMPLVLGFIWTLLPESWCHLVVTACMGIRTVPTSTSQTPPQSVVQLQVQWIIFSQSTSTFWEAEQPQYFSKSHSHLEESFLQRIPKKVKGKLCFSYHFYAVSRHNLLGKGETTVTLRDSNQQQALL